MRHSCRRERRAEVRRRLETEGNERPAGDRGGQGEAVAAGLAELSGWAAGLAWRDVPESARRRVARLFADDLAAIVAARAEPELGALTARLVRASGPPEATLFDGSGRRLDRYSAALANGCAADWCELDGGYREALCHAGLYCLPAVLAEGEAAGSSLEAMLRALLVGYETVTRVARTFERADLALHPHGSLAAIGAAAAVAALRGHPPDTTAAAISTAATLVTPGPFNHAVAGALVRNVWPGLGAAAGIRAVDWAEIGITGLGTSLHDVQAVALGGTAHASRLARDLGAAWAVEDAYHKVHACCQYGHAAVEATLALLESRPHADRDLRRIRIETHGRARKLDNVHPATTLAAKFSLQHILATTAYHGHAGAPAFHADTLSHPAIAALREKVAIAPFEPEPDPPNDRPARVTWELEDGTLVARETLSARGGPDRPFTEAEIRSKIRGILDEPYHGLSGAMMEIMDLAPDVLARPWRETAAAGGPAGRERARRSEDAHG